MRYDDDRRRTLRKFTRLQTLGAICVLLNFFYVFGYLRRYDFFSWDEVILGAVGIATGLFLFDCAGRVQGLLEHKWDYEDRDE